MRNPWILCILAACGSPAVDGKPLSFEVPVLRPQPGADLDGDVPAPVRGKRVAHGAVAAIDFASDRVPVAVKTPAPPRGGATTFTFADANGGDERRGWV